MLSFQELGIEQVDNFVDVFQQRQNESARAQVLKQQLKKSELERDELNEFKIHRVSSVLYQSSLQLEAHFTDFPWLIQFSALLMMFFAWLLYKRSCPSLLTVSRNRSTLRSCDPITSRTIISISWNSQDHWPRNGTTCFANLIVQLLGSIRRSKGIWCFCQGSHVTGKYSATTRRSSQGSHFSTGNCVKLRRGETSWRTLTWRVSKTNSSVK